MTHLSWKIWLSLTVAVSAIGSLVGLLFLIAAHLFLVGNVVGSPVVLMYSPVPEALTAVFFFILANNLCGALLLMAAFAIVRRVRRS